MDIESFLKQYYIPYYQEKTLKPLNFKKWNYLIGVIRKSDIINMDLSSVKKHHIIDFLIKCERERHISKATLNRYITCLSGIFTYAIDNDIIETNPIKRIKKNKEFPRHQYLTFGQAALLLQECKNSRSKDLFYIVSLALNTGMRQGEILSLRRCMVSGRSIRLDGRDTKTGTSRIIPLNQCAYDTVNRLLNKGNSDYLFNIKGIRNAFESATARAGLHDIRFHDLRRTFATHMKDANIDIHTISKILGHSNITTTERYLGLNDTNFNGCVEAIAFKIPE